MDFFSALSSAISSHTLSICAGLSHRYHKWWSIRVSSAIIFHIFISLAMCGWLTNCLLISLFTHFALGACCYWCYCCRFCHCHFHSLIWSVTSKVFANKMKLWCWSSSSSSTKILFNLYRDNYLNRIVLEKRVKQYFVITGKPSDEFNFFRRKYSHKFYAYHFGLHWKFNFTKETRS